MRNFSLFLVVTTALLSGCDQDTSSPDGSVGMVFVSGQSRSGSLANSSGLADLCLPQCPVDACGDDGCGGSCGTCDEGSACVDGQCVIGACVGDCADKECGDNGCGESCGECLAADSQCVSGLCVGIDCIPDCDGNVCGGDGCGGSCGGGCLEEGDLDLSGDGPNAWMTEANTCLVQCVGEDNGCAVACLGGQTGVGSTCSGCIIDAAACSLDACVGLCAPNQNHVDCVECRETHCGEGFEACSCLSNRPWVSGQGCDNGVSEGDETCASCPKDCGSCPELDPLYCFEILGCFDTCSDASDGNGAQCLASCEEAALPQELTVFAPFLSCLLGCYEEGDGVSYTCMGEQCLSPTADCYSGSKYGQGSCIDLFQCLKPCEGVDCFRECHSDAALSAVIAKLAVDFCLEVACAEDPTNDCYLAAIDVGGACLGPALNCN